MEGVRAFYESAVSHALTHLPLKDELLQNAQFVNIRERVQANFTQVTCFVENFSEFLPYTDTKSQELLSLQFAKFWTIQDSTTPVHTWNDAKELEKLDGDEVVEYHRMDILWAYLGSAKDEVGHESAYNFTFGKCGKTSANTFPL